MLPDPLHPLVVHFPVVFAVLAPVFALGALWAIRKGTRPSRAWGLTTLLLGALAISSWVAVRTGEAQEERVEDVLASEGPLHTHEEAAEVFLLAAAGVLVVAAIGLAPGLVGRAARVAGTAGTLVLVVMGYNVGRSGGDLVYRHGAARTYTDVAGRVTTDAGAQADREGAAPSESARRAARRDAERGDDDDDRQ